MLSFRRTITVTAVFIGLLALIASVEADTGRLSDLRASNYRGSNNEYALQIVLSDGAGGIITSFSGVSAADDSAFTVGTSSMTPVGGTYRSSLDSVNDGDTGAFAMLANRIQMVHLVDAAGATASVGGGTQYTEADTDATITGTALLFEGAANALVAATGDATNGLDVDVTRIGGTVAVTQSGTWDEVGINDSGNSITVDGTVTVTDGAGALNVICDSGCSGGAQYTEDAAAAADPVGNALIVVRADTPAGITSTNGDNVAVRGTDYGALYVTLLSPAGAALTPSTDATVGSAGPTSGPFVQFAYKEFDGAALPTTTNVGTEEEAAPAAVTLQGVQFGFLVNEDGSKQLGKLEDDAHTTADYALPILTRRRDTAAASSGTEGDYQTLDTDALGRVWIRNGDPCADPARITHAAISESTAATNEIVALNGSDLIYVCSYKWVTTAANSLSWTRGTGSDCGTGTTAIEGAQPYDANGGVTEQGGGHALFVVPAGNALCLVSSAATAHGGRVSYVRTAAP